MNKALRLLHIDFFSYCSMQKHIIHIHLSKGPAMRESNNEHNFDCLRLDNWAECFRVVNAKLWIKVFGNELCFVVGNRAIQVALDAENPFVANDIKL